MTAGTTAAAGETRRSAEVEPYGVSHLDVHYGHHLALDDVSLAIPRGRITAVVGGDGAGKTTLLRTLAGLVRPAGGEVRRPDSRALGFVSGADGVYRDLTVVENLAFSARAYDAGGLRPIEARDELLQRVGLGGFEDRLAGDLSGGMRQKLAVSLALLHGPKVLVLDEATTGVDPVSRAELWRIFAGAAASGAAVLLATTYLDEAERASWVCVLDRGRVLMSAPPGTVLDDVRDAIWTVPADRSRPPVAAAWRSGAVWRLWSPDGPPPDAPEARPAEPELADAVVVASFAAEEQRPDGVAGPSPAGTLTAAGPAPERHVPAPTTAAASAPASDEDAAETAPGNGRGSPSGPLVVGRRLVRSFGHFVAVDHVDVDVHPGEIVGLLGANGAGKTTLIRMLLGLLRQTDGKIELFGLPPSRETRELTGYVPQSLGLWDDLTVGENLAFAAVAFGAAVTGDLDPELAAARTTLVRDLPLGFRRRLAFAAALAHDPKLLVLDEPTSGVDPLARARLWDTVHDAVGAGVGALVTTHYMDEAVQCDRLLIMAEGRVVAAGTGTEIVAGRTCVEVRTDDWAAAFSALDAADEPVALSGRRLRVPSADPAAVGAVLTAQGVDADLRQVPATLEEVFVAVAHTGGRPAS